MKLTIYTDGASRGNPGPSSYGFLILDENGKILYQEGEYIGINTNNFAEYSAVLAALQWIDENKPDAELKFLMDSKLVVEQLSGRFKIKSSNLKNLYETIKRLEFKLSKISFQHIPRTLNKLADALANMALDNR